MKEIDILKEKLGTDYIILDDYTSDSTKVRVRHKKCNNEYLVTPNRIKAGNRCPFCAGNIRKTTEQFKDEVKQLTNNEYSILSEYINCKKHVLFKHNTCGNTFEMSPDHFLRGYRCPKCSYKKLGSSRKHKTEDVKKILEEKGYELLSEYRSSNEKILVKSKTCGHKFYSIFRNLKTGYTGCPICRLSKGENDINEWLIKNNYNFERQYRIKECKLKRTLPFDFAVFKNNEIYLIEYNGIQHYENRPFGNKKDTLEKIQERDKIKKDFTKKNNLKLLVIKYTEKENIPTLLKDFLGSTTIHNGSTPK